MSNSHIDNLVNAVTTKISTVVNNHNSSSNAHSSILSNYLQTTDVKDNLTSTDTNKPLSAKQGKELKALIDAKEDNIEVITGSVKNSSTLQGTISASSLSGKLFIYILPSLSEVDQNADVVIHLTLNGGGTTISGGYVYKNGSILKYQELQGESWLLLANHGSLHVLSSSSYAEANHTHSNYLTSHQDISGKENISNKTSNWNNTPNDTRYPTEKLVKDSLDGKADNNHTHEVLLSSNDDSDIQLFNVSAQGYPQGEGQPLGAFLSEFWKKIYPVGSIYMSVNSTSPQTLFGGTWEQIQDRFLLASGSTYDAGNTGGSSTVSLTQSQMPRHNHTQNSHHHTPSGDYDYFLATPTGAGAVTRNSTAGQSGTKVQNLLQASQGIARTNTDNVAPTIKYTGGSGTSESASNGSAHENMPPYLTVYMWKRTA